MGYKEAFRREVLSRARVFKRSWIDMAAALTEVRGQAMYRNWGYETMHGYALEELNIKRSTCDKLTGSYRALEQHVPHVLEWDGVAQSLPELEAIDYFAKAVEPRENAARPPREIVADLKEAIFEEQASPQSLRRRFNPVLHPKPETDAQRELYTRIRANAKRLEALLDGAEELTENRRQQVSTALRGLQRDLDELET